MARRYRRLVFLLLVLAGLALRAVGLPLSGTSDVRAFKIWTYNAARLGPARVYETDGPSKWPLLTFNGQNARLDYPPLALQELALVGRGYRMLWPAFPDDYRLTVAVKLLPLAASLGLTALLFLALQRFRGSRTGQDAALAYWLNPAVILQGGVLGYIGAACALPAVGALVAAAYDLDWLAGALLAGACLTKPQGLLAAPAVLMALSAGRSGQDRRRRLTIAAAAAATLTAAAVWPLVRVGTADDATVAVAHLLTDGTLSANAVNFWWLVTYLHQAAHHLSHMGVVEALTQRVEIVTVRALVASLGAPASTWTYLAFSAATWTVVLLVVAWAMRQASGASDLPRIAALAAFTVHAYAVLSVQVHENHLAFALPLLAIVAGARRDYRQVLIAVSIIAGLNLYLFYGFGEGVGYMMRRRPIGIDATVPLATLNCAALWWHAAIFKRACLEPPVLAHVPGVAE